MATMLLTVEHEGTLFTPPVKDDIKIEWERTGSPGKLVFTTLKVDNMDFAEGDAVCFYYDDKKVFMGYVFEKKRDKKQQIQVTCYDQLRYFKNKYTYVFEKKTATQIIQAICKDHNLHTGTMANTKYVIPHVVEENISAFDIILETLEETLLNSGDMYTIYDDFGELTLKNVEDMVSETLIIEDTAQDFDYTSSIDKETYNSIVLYYKPDSSKTGDKTIQVFSSSNVDKINKWGTLRYFEEIRQPSLGPTKARQLLELYCRKTRELKVNGAFGDITVRGGTLIPVKLNLGDTIVNNYMLVTKVKHTFTNELHTMDLSLEGAWEDTIDGDQVVSHQFGVTGDKPNSSSTSKVGTNAASGTTNNSSTTQYGDSGKSFDSPVTGGGFSGSWDDEYSGSSDKSTTHSGGTTHKSSSGDSHGGVSKKMAPNLLVRVLGGTEYAGSMTVTYVDTNKKTKAVVMKGGSFKVPVCLGTTVKVAVTPAKGHSYELEYFNTTASKVGTNTYKFTADDDKSVYLRWVK